VIHINFSSAEVDSVYFPQIEVVGDIAHTIERLTDALSRQTHWDFRFFEHGARRIPQAAGALRGRPSLSYASRAHRG
jgi:thiamine pyrophosphate-dependent acetolactate synthase large subunit-like protein